MNAYRELGRQIRNSLGKDNMIHGGNPSSSHTRSRYRWLHLSGRVERPKAEYCRRKRLQDDLIFTYFVYVYEFQLFTSHPQPHD